MPRLVGWLAGSFFDTSSCIQESHLHLNNFELEKYNQQWNKMLIFSLTFPKCIFSIKIYLHSH